MKQVDESISRRRVTHGNQACCPGPLRLRASEGFPLGYTHLGVSKEIVPTLRDLGVDPDPVIRAAGLDPRLFDDGMSVIPFAALGRLYTLCVARTGCAHFGLLVGQRARIMSLGRGWAPDAALEHRRRCLAHARVEPEHPGPGRWCHR